MLNEGVPVVVEGRKGGRGRVMGGREEGGGRGNEVREWKRRV